MKLISIIIPVYNGEKHIEKCINNILKQTYKSIEIIIINDGSKDNTKNILDKMQQLDKRIRVINKENTGVSDTRNVGIENAKGEFLLFLDSDDEIIPNAIENIVNNINSKNIDMYIFGFKVIGSNNRCNDTEILKKIELLDDKKKNLLKSIIATKDNIYGYIWRALYSKKMLDKFNIRFPYGIKISEDYMFFLNCIYNSDNIVIDSTEYYQYIINESSMSIKYIPSLLEDMLYVNDWMYNTIVKNEENLLNGYYSSMCNTYLRFVQNTARNKNLNVKRILEIIYKNKDKFKISLEKVGLKKRLFNNKDFISIWMFKFNLEFIYVILFKTKEKIKRN